MVELACQAHGPRDGRPVLLVHGFPLDGAMWRLQVGPLTTAGHRVLVPDLRGFGHSPTGQGAASIDAMAQDLAALLARQRIQQCTVVGFSMGGYVALALAAARPDLLEGLVLVDTRAEADTPEGRAKRLDTHAKVAAEGVKPLVQAMLPGMLTTQTWAARRVLVEEVRAMMMRQPRQGVLDALMAMADRPDRRPALGGLRMPTLVVVGDQDNVTPVASARSMQEAIPGASLQVVPSAAHLVPMEQPEAFHAALLPFLGSLG